MVQIHGIRRASADAKYRQMTGQPVKPLILKLCLPAVISNLVTTWKQPIKYCLCRMP